MNITGHAKAAFEMARCVGIRPTTERINNYFYARLAENRRANQFRRMNLSKPVVRDILGQRMRLDPNTPGLDRDLLLDGIREPVATGYIMRSLRPDDVVLEVGANIGYYALMEARLCRRVYAAEPHPENFRRLNENIALNNFKNIETYNIGFGPEDSPLNLSCSDHSNWHSCSRSATKNASTIEIPGYRIDTFMADKEPASFMKMDVEGFEVEVLRGATKTLQSLRCIFLELHGSVLSVSEIREVLDMLKDAGLVPSLVAQYDRPGLCRTYEVEQVENIYRGDRGTYELFFSRK
jgi:FkbM family methyltransferase